jgi:hypothetical protein
LIVLVAFPTQTTWVNLAHIDLNIVPHGSFTEEHSFDQDKPIALEAKATSKSMSHNNFMSALMMKNPNVKAVHFEMALQQAKFHENYSMFINSIWPEKPTMSSKETQLEIISEFQHLLKHH